MQKLKLHTPDLTAANVERIAALFPNCVTEATDQTGKFKRAIDFDLLKQELSADLVEGPQERYRLDWPGKREALALANQPVALTLRPCREESVDFENTKNLYIEGDNLDALKLLQETYLGKVKMIYIDPPYNTGNDFIYDDNFSMNRSEYEELSGDRDEEGNAMFDAEKWKQNSSANGRFHSEWLSMIYPRLKLARNLLREDGVIFVSIDDNEHPNLIKICEEVFGAENHCGNFIWEKKKKPSFLDANMGTVTEYVAAFARQRSESPAFTAGKVEDGKKYPFNNAGNGLKVLSFAAGSVVFRLPDGMVPPQDMSEGNIVTELLDSVTISGGRNENAFRLKGEWRYSQDKLDEFIKNRAEILISKIPFRPNYINRSGEAKKTANLLSYRTNGVPTNEDATEEIRELFNADMMSYPKPIGLLGYLVSAVANSEDIILDFFSGSATTAHAVMQLNAEDGGRRRHIMVQLPEPCDDKSEAFKAGYKTIAEIGKERIRRAGKKILGEWQAKHGSSPEHLKLETENSGATAPDIGFRVLKIADSNFADIQRTPDELDQKELALHTEHIKPERTPEDLLFQVLVDWGVDLALPITSETISGKRVFLVDQNALAACFDTGLTDDLIKDIAARKPLRAVFRDDGFGDDNTRINVEQIFKLLSPATEVKSL